MQRSIDYRNHIELDLESAFGISLQRKLYDRLIRQAIPTTLLMTKTPPLFSKRQVITALRIKNSEWHKNRRLGIIPNPVGREGNEHRWQSAIINAIADQMNILGSEYTPQHTITILLGEVLSAEANIIHALSNNSSATSN